MLRPLTDYLAAALHRTGARRSVEASVIVEAAGTIIRQVVPELRPTDLRVVSYRQGCLTVAAATSAVGQEIQLRSEAVFEVLRETFPGHSMTRLRFVPMIEEETDF